MLTKELPGLPMKEDQATQQFMRRSIEQALSGNVKRQREIAARISQAQTETPLFYSVMTAADLTGMPHPPGIVYFVQDEGALASITNTFYLPVTLLSGILIPINKTAPQWLQTAA